MASKFEQSGDRAQYIWDRFEMDDEIPGEQLRTLVKELIALAYAEGRLDECQAQMKNLQKGS